MEDCFEGGVTAAGRTANGEVEGYFKIKWEDDYVLRAAYAITYRYSDAAPTSITLNSSSFYWDSSNQVGSTLPELDPVLESFSVHAKDITDLINITSDSVYVFMDGHQGGNVVPNRGYFSVYCVFLYERPDISDTTCVRIYTADEVQYGRQDYDVETPNFKDNTDVGLAIHSDRLGLYVDRGAVLVNNSYLGAMYGPDATNPLTTAGVRGHFYYENETLTGLDDDTANATVNRSDGLAVINSYLEINEATQQISFYRVNDNTSGANPHPSFVITYTPECEMDLSDVERQYNRCRGNNISFDLPAFDNYEWNPATGLSDPLSANTLCFADTSRWYTVKMWNDDGCSRTLPIFVTVKDKPDPDVAVQPSACPENTGSIQLNANNPRFYQFEGDTYSTGVFDNLGPGKYTVGVLGQNYCFWDSTITVPLSPTQEAAFTPTPDSGFSPLEVFFNNRSTDATSYAWLIDGEEVSNAEDLLYNFPDSGSFEISLIAYLNEESCADTATYLLRVDQGIEVMMPNIITPNGDGRNDNLVALLKGVETCKWAIYNRWGMELQSSASTVVPSEIDESGFVSLELWSPEADIPDGVYTVVFQAQGVKGKREEMVFSLTVGR